MASKCPPAAKDQALQGARLKSLLALDFCLGMRGRSCNSCLDELHESDKVEVCLVTCISALSWRKRS